MQHITQKDHYAGMVKHLMSYEEMQRENSAFRTKMVSLYRQISELKYELGDAQEEGDAEEDDDEDE